MDKTKFSRASVVNENTIVDQIEMTDEQRKQLSIDLEIDLQNTDNDKQPLIEQVNEWRRIIKIEPDQNNKISDFQGASNYRDQLTATHVKVIASILKRTLLASPIFLVDIPFNKQYKAWLNDSLQDSIEYYNMIPKLRKLVDLATEEGVSFAEVTDYVDQYDVVVNEVYLKGQVEQFKLKYPTYKILGLKDQKEYDAMVEEIIENIDTYGEARICVTQRMQDHKVDIEVRNIDELYVLPWDSCNLNDAKGVLSKVTKSVSELKEAGEIGYFDKEATNRVLKIENSNYTTDQSSYRSTERERTGTIADQDDYFIDIYSGCYRYDLGNGDGEREYYIYFARNSREILRIEPYQRSIGSRNIVAFTFNTEHNQFIGSSIAKFLKNSQDLVDTMWNQIIDNNHLANIPMYHASTVERTEENSTFKDTYGSSKLEFSPGNVIFTKGNFEQLKTSPLDIGSLFNCINLAQRNAETYDGATSGLSGRESAADPTAPARKTEIQLGQSTMRIDDYLRDLQPSLNLLGKLLLYKLINIQPRRWKMFMLQFSDSNKPLEDAIDTNYEYNKVAVRPQDIFITSDPVTNIVSPFTIDDLVLTVKGQSVSINKESLTREAQFIMQSIGMIPQISQNPQAMSVLVEKFLSNSDILSKKDIEDIMSGLKPQPMTTQDLMQKAQQSLPTPLPAQIVDAAAQRGLKIEQPINPQAQMQQGGTQ